MANRKYEAELEYLSEENEWLKMSIKKLDQQNAELRQELDSLRRNGERKATCSMPLEDKLEAIEKRLEELERLEQSTVRVIPIG